MNRSILGWAVTLFAFVSLLGAEEKTSTPRLYEIVGGPGVGKTSIIKELEALGEYVIPEAATDYILKKKELGVLEPWKESGFLWNILLMQIERENAALEKCFSQDVRIFADRGLLDHYAYLQVRELTQTQEFNDIDTLLKSIDMNERYVAIFYVPPFDETGFESEQTEARHENTDEALLVCELTKKVYEKQIEFFITVPSNLSPYERAQFIIKKVEEIEKGLR